MIAALKGCATPALWRATAARGFSPTDIAPMARGFSAANVAPVAQGFSPARTSRKACAYKTLNG
jgi:hypothetical protein